MSELPKVGDRVRLTFEGTVRHWYDTHNPFIDLEVNESTSLGFGRIKLRHADIEILSPPVVTFEPGAVVKFVGREGHYDGGFYTVLGDRKLVSHAYGRVISYPRGITSELFRRAEVGVG